MALGNYIVLRGSYGFSLPYALFITNVAVMISEGTISSKIRISTKAKRRWRFSFLGLFMALLLMWEIIIFEATAVLFWVMRVSLMMDSILTHYSSRSRWNISCIPSMIFRILA